MVISISVNCFNSVSSLIKTFVLDRHARIQRGRGGPDPPPSLKNHKALGFLSNTGPDHLENHKATNSAFNVGPSSKSQSNAILLAFRAFSLFVVFDSSHQLKRILASTKSIKVGPLCQNFLDPRMIEIMTTGACDFQQCGMCDHQSLRSACAYAQSDQNLCWSLEYALIVKLLTEHHLEFLSLKGGCRGSSESTHVKMSNCLKSHAVAHVI